jgi:hypothetical protein
MTKLFLSIALTVLIGQLALAQNAADQQIDQRANNQTARDQNGVKNGTMTQGQADRNEAKDARIQNRVNNGTETQRQANRQMNRQSRKIRREKSGN